EVVAALERCSIEDPAFGVAGQTPPNLRHRSGCSVDGAADHAIRVRVRAATVALDLAGRQRWMHLRPQLLVGARENERVDGPLALFAMRAKPASIHQQSLEHLAPRCVGIERRRCGDDVPSVGVKPVRTADHLDVTAAERGPYDLTETLVAEVDAAARHVP